ncbi:MULTISPECIES: hypothetical protein [unclassified Sphingomonas]|nr:MULTISPECIES: hypothetical protein [unclassified Sphingomonas]
MPSVLPYVLGDDERITRQSLEELDTLFADGYRKNQIQILTDISCLARSGRVITYFLKQAVARESLANMIGAQCYLLHMGGHYLARLNFWPPKSNKRSVVSDRVRRYFSIDVLHNHSFDFFTVGILGCGYRSQFYEAPLSELDGRSVGECLTLRPTHALSLSQGKAIFVTKGTDFHIQHEPNEFSLSLNFIPRTFDSVGSVDNSQLILHPETKIIEKIIPMRPVT